MWPTAQQRVWWPQSQDSAVHLVLDVGCPSVCVLSWLVANRQRRIAGKARIGGDFLDLGGYTYKSFLRGADFFFISSSLDCLSVCLGSVFSQFECMLRFIFSTVSQMSYVFCQFSHKVGQILYVCCLFSHRDCQMLYVFGQ